MQLQLCVTDLEWKKNDTGIQFSTKGKLWSNTCGWDGIWIRVWRLWPTYIDYFILIHVLNVLKCSCVDLQSLGVERHLSMDVLLEYFLEGRRERETAPAHAMLYATQLLFSMYMYMCTCTIILLLLYFKSLIHNQVHTITNM